MIDHPMLAMIERGAEGLVLINKGREASDQPTLDLTLTRLEGCYLTLDQDVSVAIEPWFCCACPLSVAAPESLRSAPWAAGMMGPRSDGAGMGRGLRRVMGNRERPLAAGLLLLWILALLLALTGLGGVPLVDWDEGIVARVALESSQAPWPHRLWPTYWGEPYLNKPPLIHWLIAACIDLWRQISSMAGTGAGPIAGPIADGAIPGATPVVALPPEWLLRLGPALLSSLIVPLLGLIQWRLRPGQRGPALATAAIALTLLPLARQGHRVMLDGSQLVAIALLWWALLGSMASWRRTLGWGALAGLAGSALLLLKAPTALPVLASALLLRALERDLRPRQWLLLALALLVGLLPGLAWHLGHWLVRGDGALQMWLGQGYARIGTAIEGHRDGPFSAVLEMVEGGWPWLPLWPFGLALAWRARSSRAGLWCLGLTLAMSLMVLPLRTQLPWYSLLLWPSHICRAPSPRTSQWPRCQARPGNRPTSRARTSSSH